MEGMNVLPPGFRFHPTDDELINDYLKKKISSCSNPFVSIIAEIDLYRFNPWELPGQAYFGEKEWFFFSQRDKKYPNGARPNRAAASGYWKATGTDKPILSKSSQCIGLKKALVFYEGRAPKCSKTNWMMYEYRLLDTNSNHHFTPTGTMRLDDWVLCRVRQKMVPAQKPKQDRVLKKKVKRVYEDTYDEFMDDEDCAQNISFLQQNPCQPQHYYQPSDQTQMIDFEDLGTSSSHSFSHETYDSPLTMNNTMDVALEGIRRVLLDEYEPQQPSKRLCSTNSLPLFSDNSCNLHIYPN